MRLKKLCDISPNDFVRFDLLCVVVNVKFVANAEYFACGMFNHHDHGTSNRHLRNGRNNDNYIDDKDNDDDSILIEEIDNNDSDAKKSMLQKMKIVVIGDETAVAYCCVDDAKLYDLMTLGRVLLLKNTKIVMSDGFLFVSVDRFTSIIDITENSNDDDDDDENDKILTINEIINNSTMIASDNNNITIDDIRQKLQNSVTSNIKKQNNISDTQYKLNNNK